MADNNDDTYAQYTGPSQQPLLPGVQPTSVTPPVTSQAWWNWIQGWTASSAEPDTSQLVPVHLHGGRNALPALRYPVHATLAQDNPCGRSTTATIQHGKEWPAKGSKPITLPPMESKTQRRIYRVFLRNGSVVEAKSVQIHSDRIVLIDPLDATGSTELTKVDLRNGEALVCADLESIPQEEKASAPTPYRPKKRTQSPTEEKDPCERSAKDEYGDDLVAWLHRLVVESKQRNDLSTWEGQMWWELGTTLQMKDFSIEMSKLLQNIVKGMVSAVSNAVKLGGVAEGGVSSPKWWELSEKVVGAAFDAVVKQMTEDELDYKDFAKTLAGIAVEAVADILVEHSDKIFKKLGLDPKKLEKELLDKGINPENAKEDLSWIAGKLYDKAVDWLVKRYEEKELFTTEWTGLSGMRCVVRRDNEVNSSGKVLHCCFVAYLTFRADSSGLEKDGEFARALRDEITDKNNGKPLTKKQYATFVDTWSRATPSNRQKYERAHPVAVIKWCHDKGKDRQFVSMEMLTPSEFGRKYGARLR